MGGMGLIVYRGAEIPLGRVHAAARELLGGHLRPDASVIVHGSAPVRVDRDSGRSRDPLAGTVRALHLAVPFDEPEVLTDLSRLVLEPRLGVPRESAAMAWDKLGDGVLSALALALSEDAGPLAVLSQSDEDGSWQGAYALFGRGRRVWSACLDVEGHYATWNGDALDFDVRTTRDPLPPEGTPGDFPVHGLQLLCGKPLRLSTDERLALIPSLWRASRPPSEGATGMWLVEDGRVVERGRPPDPDTWLRFTASLDA